MPNIGIPELLIILFVLLLVFGPKRLPGLGRTVGGELREFKDTVTGKNRRDEEPVPQVEPPKDDGEVVQGEVVSERRQ